VRLKPSPILPPREREGNPPDAKVVGRSQAQPRGGLGGRQSAATVVALWPGLEHHVEGRLGGPPEARDAEWHRDGQLPYPSMVANVDHGDTAILNCQTWLGNNYERRRYRHGTGAPIGLAEGYLRSRFRAATGYSPLASIQALHIEEAKQLLETGSVTIEAVAREVGYEDMVSFRRLFRRPAGMAPASTGASSKCRHSSAGLNPCASANAKQNRQPRASRPAALGRVARARAAS
jgi:AraC-like DNA-binding protein